MKAPKKIELTKEQLFNLAPKYIADTAVMTLRTGKLMKAQQST